MVDSDLIEDPSVCSSTTQGHLLTELIQDDFVTIYRYDEERPLMARPVSGPAPVEDGDVEPRFPWITVGEKLDN